MTPSLTYSALTDDAQAKAIAQLMAQCFLAKPQQCEVYLSRIGSDQFRAVYDGSQLVGGLALIPMGQWWAGKRVPMTGIAAVGIAPEYRGSGAAIALLQSMLQELYEQQIPLSALYPATQRLYRKVGYEQGGSHCAWKVSLASVQIKGRSLPCQAIALDAERLGNLYQQKAKEHNGHLDRTRVLWDEILYPPDETVHSYGFGDSEALEGYLLFTQNSDQSGARIQIRDWVALTPAAGQSLWSFVADHRSQINELRFKGAAIDPMLFLLPEQIAHLTSSISWFLRLVNVPQALEKRGYPAYLDTELHLEVQDELLPANQGRFVLAIANGQGTVTRGGQGHLKLDIRGLNALYAGHLTPQVLQQAGLLAGDDSSLAIATQAFTLTPAWMPDFF
jgi:predicted acetyltransferase